MENMMLSNEKKESSLSCGATAPLRPLVNLSELRVSRAQDGRYRAAWANQECLVRVGTCFPWSAPGTFVSLRDEEDREVALIPSLDEVDTESRVVLQMALREAAFAFEITHVERVRKEFEIRHWVVTCVEGQRSFQTKVDDYPQLLAPTGLLITDVAGDVFVIHDWKALDKHSRKQIALFVD